MNSIERLEGGSEFRGCKQAARLTALGCLGVNAVAAFGLAYGVLHLQRSRANNPYVPAATEAFPIEGAAFATLQYQLEEAGITVPPNLTAEEIARYGNTPDELVLGIKLEILGLPPYDHSNVDFIVGGIQTIEAQSSWTNLKVGELRIALLNQSERQVSVDTESLQRWFDILGMTDRNATIATPLIYAISDHFSEGEENQINLLLKQYKAAGVISDNFDIPACLTHMITHLEPIGNSDGSISRLSLSIIKDLIDDIYARTGSEGVTGVALDFGNAGGTQLTLTGKSKKALVDELLSVCILGELYMGYTNRVGPSDTTNPNGLMLHDLKVWTEMGEKYTDGNGKVPVPFFHLR